MATYKDAGVNIKATDAMMEDIASLSKQTAGSGQITGIGGFAGIFDLKKCGYSDPLLVHLRMGLAQRFY